MTRSQRRWHACLWIALGPLILLGLLAALSARPHLPIQADALATPDRADSTATAAVSPATEERP